MRVRKTDVGSEERDGVFIGFKKAAHANAKDGPEKDVRIEHDAFLIGHRFCLVRHSLKPATASSSEIPSASKTSCQRVAASRIASLSASLRLRQAGMK